ncbi:MAG: hypothetical protein HQL31_10875, partial [Planctomycetes bacterium]|nr:hypothetical protein [Planctomycetota bacterium]
LREKLGSVLGRLAGGTRLEVSAHPETLALIRKLLPSLLEERGERAELSFREDEGIERAGLILSSDSAQAVLRPDLQWRRMLEELESRGLKDPT